MAYQKQNFIDGIILKAEHLNQIEDGIVAIEDSLKNQDALTEEDVDLICSNSDIFTE
jgi:hypothetical protein